MGYCPRPPGEIQRYKGVTPRLCPRYSPAMSRGSGGVVYIDWCITFTPRRQNCSSDVLSKVWTTVLSCADNSAIMRKGHSRCIYTSGCRRPRTRRRFLRFLIIVPRRRRALVPTSNTASHDYHEKSSGRVSIGMGLR